MATRPYTYVEYHFDCDGCGKNTAGWDVEGSMMQGWSTARERNNARQRHERRCSTALPESEPVEEPR